MRSGPISPGTRSTLEHRHKHRADLTRVSYALWFGLGLRIQEREFDSLPMPVQEAVLPQAKARIDARLAALGLPLVSYEPALGAFKSSGTAARLRKRTTLISDRPEGRWIYYSLNEDGVRGIEQIARTLTERPAKKASGSRCC
jgi:hypothetical protein